MYDETHTVAYFVFLVKTRDEPGPFEYYNRSGVRVVEGLLDGQGRYRVAKGCVRGCCGISYQEKIDTTTHGVALVWWLFRINSAMESMAYHACCLRKWNAPNNLALPHFACYPASRLARHGVDFEVPSTDLY